MKKLRAPLPAHPAKLTSLSQSAAHYSQNENCCQRTLARRNLASPASRQVQVRIGIHVGDIVHQEGDVLGDGVNIASRIEPLAEPGGICIPVDVARQIQHNLEAAVVKVGQAELKNVQVPLEICRIVLPWEKPSDGSSRREEAHFKVRSPK
jgi:class 3 adenylate cyclase